MDHYAGIDVSLEYSSVCVVDAKGTIVQETKIASEAEALIGWFCSLGFHAVHRLVDLFLMNPIRRRPCADPGQKQVPGDWMTQKGID